MTQNKHYIVKAKCGHVGRNHYILCDFAVCASSRKEAASIARYIPRVKHDHKDAIREVREVSYEEYLTVFCNNAENPYLTSKCRRDQRISSSVEESRLAEEYEEQEATNKKTIPYKLKKYKEWIKSYPLSYSFY